MTPTTEELMSSDPKLKTIVDQVAAFPHVQSVILMGSRAQGAGSETSDYDLYAVMPTWLTPLNLRKMKALEKQLTGQCGAAVSLNPLPLFRLNQAKGQLISHKLKQGVTLSGRDFLTDLDPGPVKDLKKDWYFSYLASLFKELVVNFDPQMEPAQEAAVLRSAAKAMAGYGELLCLLNGSYLTGDAMLAELPNIRIGGARIVDKNLFFRVQVSTLILKNEFDGEIDPLEFWADVRDHLLEGFSLLMGHCCNCTSEDGMVLIDQYLKADKGKTKLKNYEYLALTSLMLREFYPGLFFDRVLFLDRIRAAVFLLAASVGDEGIDPEPLEKACKLLAGRAKLVHSTDPIVLWRNVKESIETYWPWGCTLAGL